MIDDPYRDPLVTEPWPRNTRGLWACAAALAALGAVALTIDLPLARLVQGDSAPTFLRKICGFAELFGHGWGIATLLAVLAVLDPWHRYALPRIAATSLGAGLCANLLKLFISRTRPRNVDFDLVASSWDTFGGWLPLAGNASAGQGFPSSHSATAAALTVVLVAFYPRGRWLFPVCMVLAGIQRVLSEAHFASDVCWGAAVGLLVAPLFVYSSPIAEAFDRLEQKLSARKLASTEPASTKRRGDATEHRSRPAA